MRTDLNTPLVTSAAAEGETPIAAATLSTAEREKVEKAAEKFESMFIAEMLKQTRRTTREFAAQDSVYKDRVNEDMLDFADTAVADALSGQRAFGIADAILRQLLPQDQAAPVLQTSIPSRRAAPALHAQDKPVALD